MVIYVRSADGSRIERELVVNDNAAVIPKCGNVEYFCIYKSAKPDFKSIYQVEKWGGTGGYFHTLMNLSDTTEKLRNQIKTKQVILL